MKCSSLKLAVINEEAWTGGGRSDLGTSHSSSSSQLAAGSEIDDDKVQHCDYFCKRIRALF